MANSPADIGAVDARAAGKTDGSSEKQKLTSYLAVIRDDPEETGALIALLSLVRERDAGRLGLDPLRALENAREFHEQRGELWVVAVLLEAEADLLRDDVGRAIATWKDLAKLLSEDLLDAEGSRSAYERVLELDASDTEAADALRRIEQTEKSWRKISKRFVEEARTATDVGLQVSLLLRAASLVFQNKKRPDEEVDDLFEEALRIEPGNRRCVLSYEQVLRTRQAFPKLAEHMYSAAAQAQDARDRLYFSTRAARAFLRAEADPERAATCYEHVLGVEPVNTEAISFLAKHLTRLGRFDELARLYERALAWPHGLELPLERELLRQAGMVHWRMRGDPAAAEPHFARLRKLEPADPSTLEFYREQHAGPERATALFAVLTDAYRVSSDERQKLELAASIAEAAESNPALRDRAVEAWKVVQRLDPHNPKALCALKSVYTKGHKWNALADVIKAEIEAAPERATETRIALLRELLAVYRDRLHMDGMVIGTLSRIVKLAPDDAQAIAELAEKFERSGRYNDLINLLSEHAETLSDSAQRAAAYLRIAKLWIERFTNHSQATAPLEKVVALDPGHEEAVELLKGIYTKKRAWKPLYEVLRRERSASEDATIRLRATIEMAQLASDRLQNHADAIALFKEALAIDPKSTFALEALERLADGAGDIATLIEARELEYRHAENEEARIRVLQKLALLHAERLGQHERAIECWRRILDIDPKHGRALRAVRDSLLKAGEWEGLDAVYRRIGDFEGLADVLGHESERSQDPQLKVDLSFRAARVFEQDLGDPGRALRSYERVLSVEPGNLVAVQKLASIFEVDGKWSRLRAMLEIELRAEPDPEKRVALFARLRTLCSLHLRDPEAAFGYAAQAYALVPERLELRQQLEAEAEAALAYGKLIELFLERAKVAPKEEALALRRHVATLALERLAKPRLAVPHLQAVLEAEPGESSVMDSLERIYRAEHDLPALRALLEHRIQHDDEPASRIRVLKELAQLCEGTFGDAERAAEHYRALSSLVPNDREVLLARDRLALAAGRSAELAEVLQQRLPLEEDEAVRAELATRLGLLKAERLDDAEGALEAFESVAEHHSLSGAAVDALERIADRVPALRARSTTLLADVYQHAGRYDKLRKALLRRLEGEKDEETVRRLRLEVAEISRVNLGDLGAAYASLETAFLEHPDDRELWDRLAEMAQWSGQQHALAVAYATAVEAAELADADRLELSRRTAQLYEHTLESPAEAEGFHKHVLRLDPLDEPAFAALKQLYTGAERWEDLQALSRKRLDDTVDDGKRLELLLALCFLYEEVLHRPSDAIGAYQQVLQLQPGHPAARRMLERLYAETERFRELAELLRGNLDTSSGPERVDTMWRLAQLSEVRLAEYGAAVELYEAILGLQPHHVRAQQALAGLLSVAEHRQRVAAFLEPLYQAQGAYRDLARVLEIQLDDQPDAGATTALLLRIAELHEQRTRDLDAAFAAYGRAFERDPDNYDARRGLERVSAHRESFRKQRAQLLGRAVDTLGENPALAAQLLLERAVLLDQVLADKAAAERDYERLVELDPQNADAVLTAARALAPIHEARGDFAKLSLDLERQLQFEYDPEARERLLERLAQLYERDLDLPERAIDAQQRRAAQDPENLDALRALERLYERTERFTELADVLGQERDRVEGEPERRRVWQRAAAVLEERLGDRDGAIGAYVDLITDLGPDRATLKALAGLYERAEKRPELLETLRREEEFIDDPIERAAHRFRIAQLMHLDQGDLGAALDLYDAVLQVVPDHEGALRALSSVMSDPECPQRAYAARLLVPRYRMLRAYPSLLSALEVLADVEQGPEQVEALRASAEVTERELGAPVAAIPYLVRAIRAAVDDPALGPLLAEIERLAKLCGQYSEYVTLLAEIVPSVGDAALRLAIHRKVARVSRSPLHNVRLALEHYGKLLEEQPDDEEAFAAVQSISEESGDYRTLLGAVDRRALLTSDRQLRRLLRAQQAELYEQRLNEPDRAIETLQDLLADDPSEPICSALTRLLGSAQRWDELRSVYEQQLSLSLGDPVALRYALAHLNLNHLSDPEAALRHLCDALTDDNQHEPSIELLEQLMAGDSDVRAAAAEALEPIYLGRMQWPQLTASLEVRIAAERDQDERKRLLTRLGQICEDQLEDYAAATQAYTRLFREDPRDEDLWDTLARLARMSEQWTLLCDTLCEALGEDEPFDEALVRLARYAARLLTERVEDHRRAASLCERILAFEPDDQWAFSALETAYRKLGETEKLLTLYRAQADSSSSEERRAALLLERARLAGTMGSETEQAIASFREVLDIDPDNAAALESLEGLLVQAQQWPALAEHVRGRAERAPSVREQVVHKVRLAELLETKLNDVAAAVDVYEEILDLDKSEASALAALERLSLAPEHTLRITRILDPVYRELDQWKKLIAVLEAQVALLSDDFERVRILSEVAELHERRGADRSLAFGAWARALATDPTDEVARAEVDRLAAETGAYGRFVVAYEAALEKAHDPVLAATLLTTLARVQDEKRGDFRAAIAAYERLSALDPTDPTPLEALEALHTLVGDWAGLGRILARKVDTAISSEERGELHRRIGALREQLLQDPTGAIEAYQQAAAEDERDALANEALDRLYLLGAKFEDLAQILSRRIEQSDEPAQRVELGLRLGLLLDERLHRIEDATAAYERVLDDERGNRPALRALASAYERRGLFPELLENLAQQRADCEPQERVRLLQQAALVLEQRLSDVDQALDLYAEVLSLKPSHEASIAALERLAKDPEYGARAASLVEPVLRTAGRFHEVAAVLEAKLVRLDDPTMRREELKRLAELHERERGDIEAAFSALSRALCADPGDAELLPELERIARKSGAFPALAELLESQVDAAPDPTIGADLQCLLGRIAEVELHDDVRAIAALERAVARDEREEALVALDRLYERNARFNDLREILERRVAASTDPKTRVELLLRLGDVRDGKLDDARGAFVAFREILDTDPREPRALAGMERLGRHDALAADVLSLLERCYQQSGETEKLVELVQLRVRLAQSDVERRDLLHEAARMYCDELHDPARAVPVLRRAFELDPSDLGLLDRLEALVVQTGKWRELRGLCEALVEQDAIEGQQKRTLALRAAGWYASNALAGDAAAEEQCLRWALEVEPHDRAAHARLTALLHLPGREAALVTSLRSLSELETDVAERKRLLREAAEVAERRLSDLALAASCFAAVLEADPNDRPALEALARIEAARGQFDSVVRVLERLLPLEEDKAQRRERRLQIARLHDEQLGSPAAAIAAYRASLTDDPAGGPEAALGALERLYAQTGDIEELISCLRSRVEHSAGEARAELRLRIATLTHERLKDAARAMRELEELLLESPSSFAAYDELQALYTRDERWAALIELLQRRAGLHAGAQDTRAELACLRQIAAIYETKLGDKDSAIATYARVHERDGSDRETLEALVRLLLAAEQWQPATQVMRVLLHLRSGQAAVTLALQLADIADERLNDPQLAESALQTASKAAPDNPETWRRLLALYERHGVDDKRVAMLCLEEQRVSSDTERLPLLRQIGTLYRDRLNDPKRAAAYLERAVALAPDDREGLLALSDLYIQAERSADAIPILRRVIASFGNRRTKDVAVYHHRLGQAQEKQGNLDEAVTAYEAAFRIDLTSVPILQDLGRLCFAKGDLDRAQKTYRALLLQKLGPEAGISKADVYFFLGQISLRQDDALKGRSMLERAVAEPGGHAAAAELLATLPR